MKKITRFLGLALVGSIALLLPVKAHASCSGAIVFGSYYTQVTNTSNGPSLRSNFWAFDASAPTAVPTSGNPALGSGNDNGAITETDQWLRVLPPLGTVLTGDWGGSAFDGCPDTTLNVANQRMVLSFSDVDGLGNPTFAVACVQRLPAAANQFDYDTVGAAIALVPLPKAVISNTVRTGSEANITVQSPNFGTGFYTDGSSGCTAATVIPQYDVYKQQIARNAPADNTHDTSAVWTLVGTANVGSPLSFTTTCTTTNCDVYVAVSPRYLNNFSTGEAATPGSPIRLGLNSTKLQAGPVLADTPGKGKKIGNLGGTKSQQ